MFYDVKGRAPKVGDVIWIGRRNRMHGQLVARRIVEIQEDRFIVEGVSDYLDSEWERLPTKKAPYYGAGGFIIDNTER